VRHKALLSRRLGLEARGADTPHWTQPYNIVWTEPGAKGLDSMPAGGGNIGLNVWAQKDGVLFYISSPDSFNENEILTKLARVRVTVSPNPFADSLRQELELEANTVRVSGRTADGTAVSLRIWADVHQPVIHVEGTASKPVSVTATLELDDNWKMTARPSDNGVLWSRRVPAPSSYRAGAGGSDRRPVATRGHCLRRREGVLLPERRGEEQRRDQRRFSGQSGPDIQARTRV
jgi:hypothetical protein